MIEATLQKALQLLQNHKKQIIVTCAALILLFVLIRLFAQFALINISVDLPTGVDKASVKIYTSTETKTTDIGSPGIKLIDRNVKSIIVSSDSYLKTQSPVTVPFYRYVDKKITLKHDKNAEKIAYQNINIRPCSTYNRQLDSLLSYDCTGPVSLTNRNVKSSDKVVAKFRFINNSVTPYLGGLAGFVQSTPENVNGAVLIVKGDGKTTSLPVPKDIERSKLPLVKIFSNTQNPEDDRFIIVDTKGNIFLAQPTANNTVRYMKYNAPKDYLPADQQTICRFSTDSVYCYRGKFAVGHGSENLNKVRETITKLSYNNTDATVTATNGTNEILQDFQVTTNGELYGLYYKKLIHFTPKDDTLDSTEVAQNVDSISASRHLYYVQKNGVFAIENKQSDAHQVFYSENISSKSVYTTADKTFVLGSVIKGGSTLYAYSLQNDDNIHPGNRVIDLLPTRLEYLPLVSEQDLVGNKLKLTLKVSINKLARSQANAIDQGEFEQAKKDTEAALSSRGVNVDELDITYTY